MAATTAAVAGVAAVSAATPASASTSFPVAAAHTVAAPGSAGPGSAVSGSVAAGRHVASGQPLAVGQPAAAPAQQGGRAAPPASGPAALPARQTGRAGRTGVTYVIAARQQRAGQDPARQTASRHEQARRGVARRAGSRQHAARRNPCQSSGLQQWICTAENVMVQHGTPRSAVSAGAAYIVAMHESGGNPRAANNWDSNAAAGTPSEGITQTIASTFSAYALPGHHNIWNPVDNMIAGFRYAISRYGSMNNIPGVVSVRQGGSYVGY